MYLKFFSLILIFFTAFSCRNRSDDAHSGYRPGKDDMAGINRYILQKDRERIQSYYERRGLKMQESLTGLWYGIVKEGEGDLFKEMDKVVFDYECSTLDGTKCYSSKELGPKNIILGKSELPAGLNEGIKLLRPGAQAMFILPPYLAYGLIGDGKKIPPRSTLVYNVTIISE